MRLTIVAILLLQLNVFGFDGTPWIISYLKNRFQAVKLLIHPRIVLFIKIR